MNLKLFTNSLRRRSLILMVVVALSAAMLPTAAFASGYGHQGRAWDPGPRQERPHNRYERKDDHSRYDHGKQEQHNKHQQRCESTTYRVKRGDSLSAIAHKYGVSVHQLANANGIKNPNRIYAGQVICIPC